ncbi:hypothetical protein NPIL_235101 [Nephila pilipes]|uniref:Uncharacterized protein n=1 Tax=Nephila pilipes TaxID=299642 RepID=A0A8X6J317_NEPPI|nr:hypothetical protein NPIL_235101 [Nephila pilipes]
MVGPHAARGLARPDLDHQGFPQSNSTIGKSLTRSPTRSNANFNETMPRQFSTLSTKTPEGILIISPYDWVLKATCEVLHFEEGDAYSQVMKRREDGVRTRLGKTFSRPPHCEISLQGMIVEEMHWDYYLGSVNLERSVFFNEIEKRGVGQRCQVDQLAGHPRSVPVMDSSITTGD